MVQWGHLEQKQEKHCSHARIEHAHWTQLMYSVNRFKQCVVPYVKNVVVRT